MQICGKKLIHAVLWTFVFVAKMCFVDSYTDKRGKLLSATPLMKEGYKSEISIGQPCANKKIVESIQSEYVTWDGAIEIQMSCEEGYDMPLTAPDNNIFTCRPDGSHWQPPIFPDCQRAMLPSSIFARFGAPLETVTDCENSAISKIDDNTLNMEANGNTTNLSLCDKDKGFIPCSILVADSVCDLQEHDDAESVTDLKLHEPHIFLKTQYRVFPELTGIILNRELIEIKSLLANKMQELTGYASTPSYRLKMECPDATVGIITETGLFACRGCPLGHYLDEKTKTCELCPSGTYNDELLKTHCKLCPSMKGKNSAALWNDVRLKSKDGAYTISLCPIITRDKNGNLKVKTESDKERFGAQNAQASPDDAITILHGLFTTFFCCFASIVLSVVKMPV